MCRNQRGGEITNHVAGEGEECASQCREHQTSGGHNPHSANMSPNREMAALRAAASLDIVRKDEPLQFAQNLVRPNTVKHHQRHRGYTGGRLRARSADFPYPRRGWREAHTIEPVARDGWFAPKQHSQTPTQQPRRR